MRRPRSCRGAFLGGVVGNEVLHGRLHAGLLCRYTRELQAHLDAPIGVLDPAQSEALIFGYGIGLDLTRRDLQTAAKAKGLPWDTGKAFDQSAPISALMPAADVGELAQRTLSLRVNGALRQISRLDQLIWDVPEILHELSKLYALRAGDLVFMGTPAGVAALQSGDICEGQLDDLIRLECRIAPPVSGL